MLISKPSIPQATGLIAVVLANTFGCSQANITEKQSRPPYAIKPYTINIPTDIQLESIRNLSVATRTTVEADSIRLIERASDIIDSDDPYLISVAMERLLIWARNGKWQDRLEFLVDRCIASEDPVVRWSGYSAFDFLGDPGNRLSSELRADYESILNRPDPVSFWSSAKRRNGQMLNLDVAQRLSELRAHIVELLAKHDVREALPALDSIINDESEWNQHAIEAAISARESLGKTDDT
jgi:hypothetical protein